MRQALSEKNAREKCRLTKGVTKIYPLYPLSFYHRVICNLPTHINGFFFAGNTDQDTVVYHNLSSPIRKRYIRFRPPSWIVGVSMRVKLYGFLASVAFYMIRAKSVLNTIKSIQANPYEIVHFHRALNWLNLENASIAVAVFLVTVKLLNLIRFNPHAINSRMQFFGGVVLEYSSYLDAVMSQFEFLLGKAVPMDALRRDRPFIGPTFAFLFCISTNIFLMNMLVSVLNESYSDAKSNAEENAKELEMARFIEERVMDIFHEGNTIVYHNLSSPIRARYIRFRLSSWIGGVSMRVELYGCVGEVKF
ncbi:hypothetical protein pdam_00012352 [Pocillopora damicornis]|uniref:F5/8 type C domain-containing protein n=1 Tax=Pocillopora damicornis TaxID=46731 RepID=A0A3M6U1Z0_POCDA|nr:hypothetical protein pdam_00012352 [Pocillopora damicornis]